MKTLKLIALLLLLALPASAATRISAWITITNLPTGNTQSLTWNAASNRLWTNVVASPSSQIMTTNNIQNSRTNLKVELDTYKFRNWHQVQWGTNTNDVIVYAGTNEPITISIAGLWATVRYVTNTVYLSDYVLVPPNGGQSNNFLVWQWTAVATNLSKGTQALEFTSLPFTNFPHHFRLWNPSLTNQDVYGGTSAPTRLFATNGDLVRVTLSNALATNLTGSLTNVFSSGGTNELGVFTNVTRMNASKVVFTNLTAFSGTLSNVTLTNVLWLNAGGGSLSNFSLDVPVFTNASGTLLNPVIRTASRSSPLTMLVTNSDSSGEASILLDNNQEAIGISSIFFNVAGVQYASLAADTNQFGLFGYAGLNIISGIRDESSVALGNSSYRIFLDSMMSGGVYTNNLFKGTNSFNSRVDFVVRNNTTLANGFNAATVLGSNVYIRLSGPTLAYTNRGFLASVPGTYHIVEFDNPARNMTILEQDGGDAAGNRITTGRGSINFTSNPVMLQFIYGATTNCWQLMPSQF